MKDQDTVRKFMVRDNARGETSTRFTKKDFAKKGARNVWRVAAFVRLFPRPGLPGNPCYRLPVRSASTVVFNKSCISAQLHACLRMTVHALFCSEPFSQEYHAIVAPVQKTATGPDRLDPRPPVLRSASGEGGSALSLPRRSSERRQDPRPSCASAGPLRPVPASRPLRVDSCQNLTTGKNGSKR